MKDGDDERDLPRGLHPATQPPRGEQTYRLSLTARIAIAQAILADRGEADTPQYIKDLAAQTP